MAAILANDYNSQIMTKRAAIQTQANTKNMDDK